MLLVEDDDDVREIVGEILEREEFTVLPARHGADALQVLARASELPDVVVLDLMMPHMDGPTFLARACAVHPGFGKIPVVVTTAAGRRGEVTLPPEAVTAWLGKPMELDDLLAVLHRLRHGDAALPSLRRGLLGYLARRRVDIDRLRESLVTNDYVAVADIAEQLATSGKGFGFPALVPVAERLAQAAGEGDHAAVEQVVRDLADVLYSLQMAS